VPFGKLQEILPSRPLTYRGQNAVNFVLLGCSGRDRVGAVVGRAAPLFYGLGGALLRGRHARDADRGRGHARRRRAAQFVFGPGIRGNRFAISNNVLIVSGALDGASGFCSRCS
jgi:NAD(P) transhydrogenase subunit beta